MKRSFFLAFLATTGVLTTAVAAQEGGDPPLQFCRPLVSGMSHLVDDIPVSDVNQCPGDPSNPDQCGAHCTVDISGATVGGRAPELILKGALRRCNTTVRLGPNANLDYSHKFKDPTSENPDEEKDLRELRFGQCVTLTSVNDFHHPTSQARTPRSLGPQLHYGEPEVDFKTFLAVRCNEGEAPWGDHVRISGFTIFGTMDGQQTGTPVAGIRVHRCVDVEISNMEIHGFSGQGILVQNKENDPLPLRRIRDFNQVRIHNNFIHHNQHPTNGASYGYGVETGYAGARAHIYRNVFDFNRHAIASRYDAGGYIAEENLVLKGGGWHGGFFNRSTHLFDVHGDSSCWWDPGWALCGNAGEEFHYNRNSFQYRNEYAIHIRGKPRDNASFSENVFPHDILQDEWGWWNDYAIKLRTEENISIEPGNITKTDTFGEYYSQCDFDGDGIDDLFLATGKTWWFSSSGGYQWTFLNTSSIRKKDLKFGYFDDDNRCDIITDSDGSGRWLISSGGTQGWRPLEQVWPDKPPMDGPWRPLKEVEFGRFDPNDLSHSRQTTHAFWRDPVTGKWWVKLLKDPGSMWENVGRSAKPLIELRFGDFTGDGVTDVIANDGGTWAYSESARKKWEPLNPSLNDPINNKDFYLYIANMDLDDNIDDVLRLEVQSEPAGYNEEDVTLIWWRSKNGTDPWREFKRYTFRYPGLIEKGAAFVYPKRGFVGRFDAENSGTMVIDVVRFGHFFTLGHRERKSRFPY